MCRRRSVLLLIVGAALALRVGMVLWDHPHVLVGDEGLFVEMARGAARGDGFSYRDSWYPFEWSPGTPTASRAPGAALWLAAHFRLFGDGLLVPRLLVAVASALATLLVYDVARRLHSDSAGVAGAALWAVCPAATVSWYGVTSVLAEPLTVVSLTVALWGIVVAFATGGVRPAVLAGLALGCAGLLRPTALAVLPACALWCLVFCRKPRPLALLGAAVLAQAFVVAPWTWRNYQAFHRFIPVATYGGMFFYASNNPLCTGNKGAINQEHPPWEPDVVRVVSHLPEPEAERYCRSRAWEYLRANPKRIPYLVYRRQLLFWNPAMYPAAPLGGSFFMDGWTVVVYVLCAIAVVLLRARPEVLLIVAVVLSFVLPHLLVSAEPRYRHLADPALTVLAALGCGELLRRRRGAAVLALLAALAVSLTVWSGLTFRLLQRFAY